jgi:hypothetical protein
MSWRIPQLDWCQCNPYWSSKSSQPSSCSFQSEHQERQSTQEVWEWHSRLLANPWSCKLLFFNNFVSILISLLVIGYQKYSRDCWGCCGCWALSAWEGDNASSQDGNSSYLHSEDYSTINYVPRLKHRVKQCFRIWLSFDGMCIQLWCGIMENGKIEI